MAGKTRKFAQLSPQKQRQSPAKFVRLTEHDDLHEKRERTASKIAQGHERVRSIVHLSSPRKSSTLVGGPATPAKQQGITSHENNTPVMKMPILANFEEWMKLATDNKINAGNSWNFALIDYFHEMSLLKEGDSINFQKASVTLDGCVKIYTNRVDSVATETGKLLSGLSSNKDRDTASDEEDENQEEDEDETADHKKSKKRPTKTNAGTTLVKDFSSIQAKKLDTELFVDPLFKKTSAEFDEGGAKGLLLNHLFVDREGRIIFDASDASNATEIQVEDSTTEIASASIDVEALGAQFFPELFGEDEHEDSFEQLHLCPFLQNFQSGSAVLDIPLLTSAAVLDQADEASSSKFAYHESEDDDRPDQSFGGVVDVFDNDENAQFGQVEDLPFMQHERPLGQAEEGIPVVNGKGLVVGSENFLTTNSESAAMYTQFDDLMRRNWTGPSNWKISRLQKANPTTASTSEIVKKPRKEKEVSSIDFFSTEGQIDEDVIFTQGGASINLPKSQWSSRSRNLLPEDKHFTSDSLLRLYLKPKTKFGTRKLLTKSAGEDVSEGRFINMDENFWAQKTEVQDIGSEPGMYDANFFNDGEDLAGHDQDDDDEHDAFEDAKQEFATEPFSGDDFGSQLQLLGKKAKPEYVNYAKAAKKVDVRILKENIWDKLELPVLDETEKESADPAQPLPLTRKFTDVVQSLGDVYPEQAMSEISTSFCFICLLHLANEKGLEISGEASLRDLTVRRDPTVKTIEAV